MPFTSEQLVCAISALKIRKCNVEAQAMKYISERGDCTDSKVSWLNKRLNDCDKELRMIDSTLESANIALASQGKEDEP